MDEATAVLERLARIEALEAAGASPAQLLAELRELVAEAEAWARREGGDRAANAVERLRTALARDMITV
jgi:predicted Ser/Thr protein kinase